MRPKILNKIRRAVQKVLEQDTLSCTGNRCLYRGPNGSRCIAGHCLPNREYRKSYEDKDTGIIGYFLQWERDERELIADLQNVHDGAVYRTKGLDEFREKFRAGVKRIEKQEGITLL